MSIWVYVDDKLTRVDEIPPAGGAFRIKIDDDAIDTRIKQLIKEGKIKAAEDSTDAEGKTWRDRPLLL